jgi:hypothetical protein
MKAAYLKRIKSLLFLLACLFIRHPAPAEGTDFYLDIAWGGMGGEDPLNYTGVSLGWKSGLLTSNDIPVTKLVSPGLLFDIGFFKMEFDAPPSIEGFWAFRMGAGLALVPNILKHQANYVYYFVKPNFIFYNDSAVDLAVSMGLKADLIPFWEESDLRAAPSFSLGLELPAASLYGERKTKGVSLFLTAGVLYEQETSPPRPALYGKSLREILAQAPLQALKTKRLFYSGLTYASSGDAQSYYMGAGVGWETLIFRRDADRPKLLTPHLLTEVGYANYSVSIDQKNPPNIFTKTNRNGYDIIRLSAGLLWGRGFNFYVKENILFDSKNITSVSTAIGAEADLLQLRKNPGEFASRLSPLLGAGFETRAVNFLDNRPLFSSNEILLFLSFRLRLGK